MEGRMSFSEAKTLWDEWEIRILVLFSLFLQVMLMLFGGLRKINKSGTIRLLLWIFYLMADSVAIYALGILSENQAKTGEPDGNSHLLAFWAPFLLLHLGGQDTITSFAIEDNELWTRQLLNLVSQVGFAIFVFSKSLLRGTELLVPGILMFIAGTIKYGERVWSLKSANMDSLRNSMVTTLVPGPNYAKFLEVYSANQGARVPVQITVEMKLPPDVGDEDKDMMYSRLVLEAHGFFRTFRRLIVNLILSCQDRINSQSFFLQLQWDKAYKVVEIELSLLYDILHTKAMLIGTICGRFLRCTTVLSTLTAFVLFTVRDKGRYDRADVLVTYVLFGGAIGLEIYAIGLIFFSFWTYVELEGLEGSKCRMLAHASFAILKLLRPEKKPRWSNSMAQFNLIEYCMRDQPTCMSLLASFVGAKRFWDKFSFTEQADVSSELKELIFGELKNKVESNIQKLKNKVETTKDTAKPWQQLGEYRGLQALESKYRRLQALQSKAQEAARVSADDYERKFGWSVKVEFDESVLLWHIATDLCFYRDDYSHYPKTIRAISNYMLFLLVMQPYMLEEGIGQTRFGETCMEAKNLFQQKEKVDVKCAVEKILNTSIKEQLKKVVKNEVKGELSTSVLNDAGQLANDLLKLPSPERWELIGTVWVEMLCYAAGKCKGNFHAKHLSTGGELLTIVWLLMVHMGIGQQYREGNCGRLMLIVKK